MYVWTCVIVNTSPLRFPMLTIRAGSIIVNAFNLEIRFFYFISFHFCLSVKSALQMAPAISEYACTHGG